jgi:hypothetical protein
VPLYFFNVRGGPSPAEAEEGWSHADEAAARSAAIDAARALIASEALDGILDLKSRIDVEDEAGRLIFTVTFKSVVTRS